MNNLKEKKTYLAIKTFHKLSTYPIVPVANMADLYEQRRSPDKIKIARVITHVHAITNSVEMKIPKENTKQEKCKHGP